MIEDEILHKKGPASSALQEVIFRVKMALKVKSLIFWFGNVLKMGVYCLQRNGFNSTWREATNLRLDSHGRALISEQILSLVHKSHMYKDMAKMALENQIAHLL